MNKHCCHLCSVEIQPGEVIKLPDGYTADQAILFHPEAPNLFALVVCKPDTPPLAYKGDGRWEQINYDPPLKESAIKPNNS